MISRDPDGALIVDGLRLLEALESDSVDSPEVNDVLMDLAELSQCEAMSVLADMAVQIADNVPDKKDKHIYIGRLMTLAGEVSVNRAHAEAVKLVQEARLAHALNPRDTKH